MAFCFAFFGGVMKILKALFKNQKKNLNKKKIKIAFCDVYQGFEEKNNLFYDFLKKYYDVELSDHPDFLFYSCFGNEFRKYQNCVKIFFTGEDIIPNFNECDYALGFDYLNFGERYLQYNCYYVKLQKNKISKDLLHRKFCNFLYSNASNGSGAIIRQEFFKKLSQYKFIDAPGKVCHNIDLDIEPRDGNWYQGKLDFIKNYKFTIAFENSTGEGYTTEKLFQPFIAQSVPIYWGNPSIGREINSKAFINCNDFDNDFDKVIQKIIELDNDDKKYLKMLRANKVKRNSFFRKQQRQLKKFLVNIIEKGNKPFEKDPLHFQERCW